jgi:hypothetical protein
MRRNRPPSYRGAAMTLHRESDPGDIVFTGDWDDMPQLFFYNDKNYYMNVLDPAFMYCWNPQVWREWRMIVDGMKSNTYAAIRDDFRARHVFATGDLQRFLATLARDPRFELIHRDRLCGVFHLKDEPFDFFLPRWTVAGPFSMEEDEELREAVGDEETEVFRIGHADTPSTIAIDFESMSSGTLRYGFVDLGERFSTGSMRVENATAYARAVFDAPASCSALVHLGFDDGGKVWLNGENIFHDVRPGSAVPDEHVVPVTLLPGQNVIDVKAFQQNLDWGFYCWITDNENARFLVNADGVWTWKSRKTPSSQQPSLPPSNTQVAQREELTVR